MKKLFLTLFLFVSVISYSQTIQIIQQDGRDKMITVSYDTTKNNTLKPQAVKYGIDTTFVGFEDFQDVIGDYDSFILQSAKYSFVGAGGQRVIVYTEDGYNILYKDELDDSKKIKWDIFVSIIAIFL